MPKHSGRGCAYTLTALRHEPLGYFQALCGLSRDIRRSFEKPYEGIDRILERYRRDELADVLYVSDNDGEVRIGIHKLLGRVVCAAATNPVELKQADTVFTRRHQPGPGVKFRFGECVSQGGRLLHLTEPGSGEGINDMHGHHAALRRNLVEIEATPGFADGAGGAATRAAELGT